MAQENGITLSTLRSDPTFASLSQFFHTFQAAFRPWPNYTESHWSNTYLSHQAPNKSNAEEDYIFATEDLENMLLDPSLRYQLEELILRMLRFLTRNRFMSASTWQDYFAKEWDRREHDQENPFRSDRSFLTISEKEEAGSSETTETKEYPPPSFFDLSMEARLNLLNALCEWQLDDPERLRDHMDTEDDPTQWRVDPIGYDAKGNSFWLFDDNRLYKESAPKKGKQKKKPAPSRSSRRSTRRSTRTTTESEERMEEEEEDDDDEEWTPWKLVCMTVDDWQQFPVKYSKSKHPQNQAFYQLLIEDVLPKVIPVIEEHERNRKMQEAIAFRKRSSRILVRDLEALEQQQKYHHMDDGTPELSRIEKQRLEKERLEKERQSKAREERAMERERRLEAKAHAEEMAAERKRLDRERRLARRLGQSPEDMDIDVDGAAPTWQVEGKPQEFKIILKLGGDAKKKPVKEKKRDQSLGKRKRGRKPKYIKQDEEEESWTFNCSCGVFGRNIDDGTPMIACEKCNEWQHIECLRKSGLMESDLLSFEDYAFTCRRCKEQEKTDDSLAAVDERCITSQIQRTIVPSSDSYAYTAPLQPPSSSSNHHQWPVLPQQQSINNPILPSFDRQLSQQTSISPSSDHQQHQSTMPFIGNNRGSLINSGLNQPHHASTPLSLPIHHNHHSPQQNILDPASSPQYHHSSPERPSPFPQSNIGASTIPFHHTHPY